MKYNKAWSKETYPQVETVEHWMMAGKAMLFGDEESLNKILNAGTPAQAKRLGRLVTNFDPLVWDKQKFELVIKSNWYKFGRHPASRWIEYGVSDLLRTSRRRATRRIGMAKTCLDLH